MSLELKVPPPLVFLISCAAMFGLRGVLPGPVIPLEPDLAQGISLGIAGLGILLALSGVLEFRRATTTVDPRYPEKASSLVRSGVFRYTRNPMYLGLLLCLTGVFVYLRHPPAALILPCFVFYLSRFQIAPEERAMAKRFGQDFEEYRGSVRRWI